MKKTLIVSYMFPPISGGGTLRPLKFVKYLPMYGIQPIVFCPQNAAWKAYDYKNLELPFLHNVQIYRCGIRRLQRYYYLRYTKGLRRHPLYYVLGLKYFCYLDFFSAWYFECRLKAAEIALKEKVDCVFTTSPPHSTHLFGLYLKKKLNIPWVMDIRDSMSVDPNRLPTLSTRMQATLENFYEKKFYASADAIISVSDPIINSIKNRHYCPSIESKTHTIYNGYDDDDFKCIRHYERFEQVFSITYTGSFMGRRSPEFFLKAVRLLTEKNDIEASDILVRFVGHFNDQTLALFNKFKLYFPIEVHGFQPYVKTLQYQVNSILLLLIVNVEENEGGSQIMTGKFFEYLGAARPILALVPEGPLKQIINQGQFGITTPSKDIHAIARAFKTLYEQWKQHGNIVFDPDIQLRASFSRRRLTAKLARIMDQLK
jgi:glycosyltransferase involved in cell wall biosynthesis